MTQLGVGLACRSGVLSAALFACLTSWATPAHSVTDAADALFRAGREALRNGDNTNACKWFAESNRIEPAVGTQLNWALCEERLGHLVHARQLFAEVSVALQNDDPRTRVALEHIRTLDSRIAHLVLRSATQLPAGTRIFVGLQDLTASGLDVAIPADPGPHRVEVQSPGRRVERYDVILDEGATWTLDVAPGPLLELGSVPGAADHSGDYRTWGILCFGVSGAALVTSGVLGLAVLKQKEIVEAECDSDRQCTGAGLRAGDRGDTFGDVASIAFLTAVAAGTAGVTLVLLDDARPATRSRDSGPKLGVTVGPGHASVRAAF